MDINRNYIDKEKILKSPAGRRVYRRKVIKVCGTLVGILLVCTLVGLIGGREALAVLILSSIVITFCGVLLFGVGWCINNFIKELAVEEIQHFEQRKAELENELAKINALEQQDFFHEKHETAGSVQYRLNRLARELQL